MAILNRITNWVDIEPMPGFLMIIAALVVFSQAFNKRKNAPTKFWPWLRQLLESAVMALLFLGLLWAFRTVLTHNQQVFHRTHGSLSDANLQSAYSIWGRPHLQRELSVQHFVDDELVSQNSILSFTGEVDLSVSEREKGWALYNGFEGDMRFEYEIVNDSDQETEVQFGFPLSPYQTVIDNFEIRVDGKDISSKLRIGDDLVTWTDEMSPHQHKTVVIKYSTRGMEYFYYQVPRQREINDFSLTITVDHLPTWKLNYPDGCLTPMEIKRTDDGWGSILVWTLDNAITTSGMGVAIPQPQQPGADVLGALFDSPYALTLLISIVCLTLLILGEPIRFLELALLAAVYCVQYLLMVGLSDYFFGFWGSLALGVVLTGVMTFFLFRKDHSTLLRILISILVLFFALVYPLAGQIIKVILRETFDSLVHVIIIVYLFVVALYARRKAARDQTAVEVPEPAAS